MKLLMTARVRAVRDEAVAIKSFELVPTKRVALPPFIPGAHVTVQLPNGLKRQYSLTSDPDDLSYYRLAVLRETCGLGGSEAMHRMEPGDELYVSYPDNRFPLAMKARRHVFLAGGIGITPFVPMVREIKRLGGSYVLHYCARSNEQAAFVDELRHLCSGALILHFDDGDPALSLDIGALLRTPEAGTHVYCCGPPGFMAAARIATSDWPSDAVHFEAFVGLSQTERAAGEPFELVIASTGQTLFVSENQTALEVLKTAGFEIDSSCRAGACGSCKIRYLSGEPVHRDFALHPKNRPDHFISCVSRAKGRLTLDL